MGVVKVEQFDVDVNNGAIYTLSNIVDTSKAFVRHTSSSDRCSGLIGTTGNLGPRDAGIGGLLTGSNQVSFYSGTASNQKFIGEVWRYTGSGGASEFVVRDHMTIVIPVGQSQAVQAITNLGDRNKVIPFLTGIKSTSTSVNDFDSTTVTVYVNALGEVVAKRGATTVEVTAYIEVVEFTGSSWSVGHGISTSHDGSLDTVTLNSDSTGAGGSTFDVGSWNSAFIEGTMAGDNGGETGLSDVLARFYPGANTTSVVVDILSDGKARNDNDAYIHVLTHASINATRGDAVNLAEGNNSYGTPVSFAPTGALLEDLALEWYSDTSGVGTAHARGRLNAKIATDGTIAHWVHRSGNNVNARHGVIDLTYVDDILRPKIATAPSSLLASGNMTITGERFGATQGEIYISESSVFADAKTKMTVGTWSDTSIQFFFDSASFLEGLLYIYVVDSSAIESNPKRFTYGRLLYDDEVLNLAPDHYWSLNGDYSDTAGANPMSTRVGTVNFVAEPLVRGRSQSVQILNGDSGTKISDSSNINTAALTARTMGGWIQLNQQQTALVNIYEEGGSVNNIAFFLGMGGVLIAQLADTGDDNVHVYSDEKLVVGRPYHIIFRFDYSTNKEFELFVDGVKQSLSFGNPLTSTNLDGHSGDISWGKSESNLEVFGTDVDFTGSNNILYSDWYSWKKKLSDLDIFEKLFISGIRSRTELTADSQVNMQAQLDGIASLPADVCSLTIPASTDGDFTLEANSLSFPSTNSHDLLFLGGGTLTWINLNGSNVSAERVLAPYGGNVIIVNPAEITIGGVADGSKIVILDFDTKSEVASIESSTGDFVFTAQSSSIDVIVIHPSYKLVRVSEYTIVGDAVIPIVQEADYSYDNPV